MRTPPVFSEPSGFQGAEKLAKTREVRDAIKEKDEQWCARKFAVWRRLDELSVKKRTL